MKHLAWAALATATAIAVAASCVPDFQFREAGTGGLDPTGMGGGDAGGAGGVGGVGGGGPGTGGAGGSGGSGGSGGTGGGGPPVVMVPCGVGAYHVDCPAGEFCCYHENYEECDVCTEMGVCDAPFALCGGASNYRLLRCNGPEDCGPGQRCCEDSTGDNTCYASCGNGQRTICTDADDCPPEAPYCVGYMPPYTGYQYCSASMP